MLRRQFAGLIVATMIVLTLFCASSPGITGPREKAKTQPPAGENAKEQAKAVPQPPTSVTEKLGAQITKMLDEFDLKPQPPASIPDNPPPHEGAMISLTYVVEPPDHLIVEVLEALPGRPISGERLVKPDGNVDLGFYGEVYVRGLTLKQVKVAIIKQVRKYVADDNLGLGGPPDEAQVEWPQAPQLPGGGKNPFDTDDKPGVERPPTPQLPAGVKNPFDTDDQPGEDVKPRSSSSRIPLNQYTRGTRSAARQGKGIRVPQAANRSRLVRASTREQVGASPAHKPNKFPVGIQANAAVTVKRDGQSVSSVAQPQPTPKPHEGPEPIEIAADDGNWKVVPPAQSDRVFVDFAEYNSKNYYVLGDVHVPGRLPCTGNETVLDALQFAGGLMPTAEPKDIRLVRPGRGGKPARVYKIDLAAIQEKGDATANYQVFPGDRLIVGRNEVVKKTVAMDRLNAPIQTASTSIHNLANMLRAVQLADQANSGQILKDLVDFWAKEVSRKDDLNFDEQTLRDALLEKLKPASTPRK
jgi:protein involved in polysaccharide export with SLBB domain